VFSQEIAIGSEPSANVSQIWLQIAYQANARENRRDRELHARFVRHVPGTAAMR